MQLGKLFCGWGKLLGGCESDSQIKLLQKNIEQLLIEKTEERTKLNADIAHLLEQLAQCYGVEKPSPADIVKQGGIKLDNSTAKFTVDMRQLNIPFTKQPRLEPITEIPDTNSMDGLFDYGNNVLYIRSADAENHKIMVDWIAQQWLDSKGLLTADCVYRIMVNEADDPNDFNKPGLGYIIHRLVEVGQDDKGRFFWFKGINNLGRDMYPARDSNILCLNIGVVY